MRGVVVGVSGQVLWVCERVGDDVLLYRPGDTEVYRLPGPMWSTVQILCREGEKALSVQQQKTLASHGVKLGSELLPPTRRRVVAGAAALTGAGMVSLALPPAAMASSPENNDPEPTFIYDGSGLGWLNLRTGVIVSANLDGVFEPGARVTLRVIQGAFDETATISLDSNSAGQFTFEGRSLVGGPPVEGILTGPSGEVSNRFTIAGGLFT